MIVRGTHISICLELNHPQKCLIHVAWHLMDRQVLVVLEVVCVGVAAINLNVTSHKPILRPQTTYSSLSTIHTYIYGYDGVRKCLAVSPVCYPWNRLGPYMYRCSVVPRIEYNRCDKLTLYSYNNLLLSANVIAATAGIAYRATLPAMCRHTGYIYL